MDRGQWTIDNGQMTVDNDFLIDNYGLLAYWRVRFISPNYLKRQSANDLNQLHKSDKSANQQ